MRVAVLGAGGTIAPAIVRDLAESAEVSDLLLLDLDEAKAAAVAGAHGAGKARAVRVDARAPAGDPSSLAGALVDSDVLVNSASYRVNLDAMRACLASTTHYLDLGGLYWMTGRQLELDEEFRRAGLLAVLGIGSSPGKTNLMAARAVRELGGGADAIHVSAAGRDLRPPNGFSVPYALQTLVDEVSMSPIVLRGGKPEEIAPLTAGGAIDFGEPIGSAEAIFTLHSELRTFGESFGCRECTFRLSLHPVVLDRLRSLVGADDEEIARIAEIAQPPSGRTIAIHMVDAIGAGRRVRVRCVTRPIDAWGLGGGIVSTAAPSAAVVRLMARGAVTARGVLPPEACLEPEAVFAELEQHGSKFEVGEFEAEEERIAS